MATKPVPPKLKRSPRPYMPKDSPEARETFLQALRECKTVSEAAACIPAGVNTVRAWRDADPEFAAAWKVAYDEGTDVLEREAIRRATEGTEEVTETVSDGPKGSTRTVTTVRKRSDQLMTLMLAGRRPEYRKSNVELSGPDGGPVQATLSVEFMTVGAKK